MPILNFLLFFIESILFTTELSESMAVVLTPQAWVTLYHLVTITDRLDGCVEIKEKKAKSQDTANFPINMTSRKDFMETNLML